MHITDMVSNELDDEALQHIVNYLKTDKLVPIHLFPLP
jgi:hypothetical protein